MRHNYFLLSHGVAESQLPDDYVSEHAIIPPSTIISRKKNGDVESIFSNDKWDLSPYVTQTKGQFNFGHIRNLYKGCSTEVITQGVYEAKLAVYLMWFDPDLGSVNTLAGYFTAIKHLVKAAAKRKLPLSKYIDEPNAFNTYKEFFPAGQIKTIHRRTNDARIVLKKIVRLSLENTAVTFQCNPDFFKDITREWKRTQGVAEVSENQTALIPTRILSELITQSFSVCDNFLALGEKMLFVATRRVELLDDYLKVKGKGVDKFNLTLKQKNTAMKTVDRYLGMEIDYSQMGVINKKELNSYISFVQKSAAFLVFALTGMRDNELKSIPFEALQEIKIKDDVITVVRAYHSKFSRNAVDSANWITTRKIATAIEAAQLVTRLTLLRDWYRDINELDAETVPLFISLMARTAGDGVLYDYPTFHMATFRPYDERFSPNYEAFKVTAADLEELDQFDRSRDWDSFCEKGKLWPLATHQPRRCLAVYGSGHIDAPVLKNQFKQTYVEMALHYANNSAFAAKFVNGEDQKAFVNEFNEELIEHKVDLLMDNVVSVESRTFGGAGTYYQKQKNAGKPVILDDSRETIRKKVRNGELSMQETPLGGCTKVDSCDRRVFTSLTTCVGCSDSVFYEGVSDKILEERAQAELDKADRWGRDTPFGRACIEEHQKIRTVLDNRITLEDLS